MSGSEGVRFDPERAKAVSDTCWEKRKQVTDKRERVEAYFNAIPQLWVGDAADEYRRALGGIIRDLGKLDQTYWDMLKLFDMDREKLEAADKKAKAVADAIEPAVWADVDTGMA